MRPDELLALGGPDLTVDPRRGRAAEGMGELVVRARPAGRLLPSGRSGLGDRRMREHQEVERLELKLLALGVGDAGVARVEAVGIAGWCVWPDAPRPGAVVDVELSVQRAVPWADVEVGRPTGAPSRLAP